MDLASAHEGTEDPKKQPMLIGVGVVIGVVVACLDSGAVRGEAVPNLKSLQSKLYIGHLC